MNLQRSRQILEVLQQVGVHDLVFCAGARNSPLVSVLPEIKGITSFAFFEERSAAFFALGRARVSARPVAVITTSGTAAAELLPAAIEAFYSGVPLILVTADRPSRLRATGAPQCIDQTHLFQNFTAAFYDLEQEPCPDLHEWRQTAPIHLNVCFDEPLLDEPLRAAGSQTEILSRSFSPQANTQDLQATDQLQEFLLAIKNPVAVVGTIDSNDEREAVVQFLLHLQIPVYLESTSGLREDQRLAHLALRSGDRILNWALNEHHLDSVIRLGGVPTVRVWRDLEQQAGKIPVCSISPLPFSGLSRCLHLQNSVADFDVSVLRQEFADRTSLLAMDRELAGALLRILLGEPLSEPGMIAGLSRLIPNPATTYLGNSLPIREWDLAASFEKSQPVWANRGANGIDGQISTFLGIASRQNPNWCMVGDLTALYDLTGPWALRYLPEVECKFVVINNGGGKIFSRMFHNPMFENQHDLEFSNWAAMWRLKYERWTEIPRQVPAGSCVIEISPDAQATERFWQAYDQLWLTKGGATKGWLKSPSKKYKN